jgi:D-sedoheptulose 7-phosphate isomerase
VLTVRVLPTPSDGRTKFNLAFNWVLKLQGQGVTPRRVMLQPEGVYPFRATPNEGHGSGGQNEDDKSRRQVLTSDIDFTHAATTVGLASVVDSPPEFAAAEVAKLQDSLTELASEANVAAMTEVAGVVVNCLQDGGKVLFCGNGGSAADAQHLAAELVCRQNYDRAPAAGIALSVDTSVLTAVSNDYDYDSVFARQVQALGRPGDVLFGISTSGRSKNVLQALAAARSGDLVSVAFTGRDPRDMGGADYVLAMPAIETAKVQELQLVAGHIIFALVERALFPRDGAAG